MHFIQNEITRGPSAAKLTKSCLHTNRIACSTHTRVVRCEHKVQSRDTHTSKSTTGAGTKSRPKKNQRTPRNLDFYSFPAQIVFRPQEIFRILIIIYMIVISIRFNNPYLTDGVLKMLEFAPNINFVRFQKFGLKN